MKKINRDIMDVLESVIVALVAVMVIFSLIFRVYVVDGDSMNSTLANGDRLLVSQLFYTPKQGDVVCLVAENHGDMVLVKRVIATEGQVVDINDNHKVTVDGKELDEPYVDLINDHNMEFNYSEAYTPAGEFPLPYTVKEGEVFVMGDNRDNSTDSRKLGPIPEKHLLGRVLIRLFPNTGVVD